MSRTRLTIYFLWAALHSAGALATDEPIKPLPLTLNQDPIRVQLGRKLFRDPRLSANDSVSCATCHDLKRGGSDGRQHSVGFSGKTTAVNAPTVFNAALNFAQFWNGRAASLEAQIDAVIQNPVEMGSSWSGVLAKLSADADYPSAFSRAYSDGITKTNVQNAIASYERSLITPNSRFDKFLRGDNGVLSDKEKKGYAKFKHYGCIACHQGVNVGGNMYQRFGVMADYFEHRAGTSDADLGRYVVTRDENDKHVFKVPSLRNVALTAPYFHDASANTLSEAVDVMFRYQIGRVAPAEDKEEIVQFLGTLTGERPSDSP